MDIMSANQWSVANENKMSNSYPIHKACRDGDSDYLRSFFTAAKNLYCQQIYVEDVFYQWTPIHWATYFGKPECLALVLSSSPRGAAFMLNLQCSINKQTALHLAAFLSSTAAVKWMLENGADPNIEDHLGETALHKAARSGITESASLLVSFGARVEIRNNLTLTPALIARDAGHRELGLNLEELHKQRDQTNANGLISSNCYHGFHPVQPQPPNAISMDATEQPVSNGHNHFSNTKRPFAMDITLSKDVLFNRISLAGKKRSRDESVSPVAKRVRPNDDVPIIPITLFMTEQEKQDLKTSSDCQEIEMTESPSVPSPVSYSRPAPSAALIPIGASDEGIRRNNFASSGCSMTRMCHYF